MHLAATHTMEGVRGWLMPVFPGDCRDPATIYGNMAVRSLFFRSGLAINPVDVCLFSVSNLSGVLEHLHLHVNLSTRAIVWSTR